MVDGRTSTSTTATKRTAFADYSVLGATELSDISAMTLYVLGPSLITLKECDQTRFPP